MPKIIRGRLLFREDHLNVKFIQPVFPHYPLSIQLILDIMINTFGCAETMWKELPVIKKKM